MLDRVEQEAMNGFYKTLKENNVKNKDEYYDTLHVIIKAKTDGRFKVHLLEEFRTFVGYDLFGKTSCVNDIGYILVALCFHYTTDQFNCNKKSPEVLPEDDGLQFRLEM